MYKFTLFLAAFLSFFFQSAIAAPIELGYRANVTLYIQSDNSDINGQTLYTLDNTADGFNRLYIGNYVDPKSTFFLVKSALYQQLSDNTKVNYYLSFNSDGYLGTDATSTGVNITGYDGSTGKLQFENDESLYAVHVVDLPAYSASQYAIQVYNSTSAPENSYKIDVYARLNWAVL
ncbi:hypothetical protein SBY92_004992 [Candida maltosa Xu316]|uniref:Uncharacterized protein n=1 Tax=Candida maltosa (strain Xu316) TaxID=1245528 RepID=M3IGU6_CANMX|nr:hypothetical protein G210_4326 [Candida maltosa Xu316]